MLGPFPIQNISNNLLFLHVVLYVLTVVQVQSEETDQASAISNIFTAACQRLQPGAGDHPPPGTGAGGIWCEESGYACSPALFAVWPIQVSGAEASGLVSPRPLAWLSISQKPGDEWPMYSAVYNGIRGAVDVRQPTTDQARCQLARAFIADFQLQVPMLVDPINNPFDEAFAPWPLRSYILHKGKIALKVISCFIPSSFRSEPQAIISCRVSKHGLVCI